jgi:hypothetical protein
LILRDGYIGSAAVLVAATFPVTENPYNGVRMTE